MLYNKNNVRKTNDKKILHKVGKQWKVISVALLMAVAGGAAATHAANAQSNNDVNASTSAEVQALEQKPAVPSSAASSASSSAAKPAKPAKPASSVSYDNGNNGSAASYHAKAENDNYAYETNMKTVNKYVNSLNAEFSVQTASLNSAYNSDYAKTTGDQTAAQSYSAIANNKNYSSQVSSLASKAGLTYSGYVQSVSYKASSFASAVSNGTSQVSQLNVVNSYAQLIDNLDHNSGLKAGYGVKKASVDDAYTVALAYRSNAQAVYNNLMADVKDNDNALNDATSESINNSAAEEIAHVNSGLDAATTNSLASALGFVNTSSETSSNTSSNADVFSATNNAFTESYNYANGGTSNVSVRSNSASDTNDIRANDMYVLLSDTATMQKYDSVSARDNSTVASATAAKASLSEAVTSASAAVQSNSNNVSSLADVKRVDDILGASGEVSLASLFGSVKNTPAGTKTENRTFDDVANSLAAANGSTHGMESALGNTTDADAIAQLVEMGANKDFSANNIKSVITYYKNVLANVSNNVDVQNALTNDTSRGNGFALMSGLYAYDANLQNELVNGNNLYNDAHSLESALDNVTSTHTVTINTKSNASFENNGLLDPTSYADAYGDVNVYLNNGASVASDASDVNSVANSAANSLGSEEKSSSAYSAATKENVTLAGIYANSYSNDVTSDKDAESAAKNSLDTFYLNHADSTYANASYAANSASSAEPNDAALAHANGVHVYNYAPKYVTVNHNGLVHSNTNYGSRDDKVIAHAHAGDEFQVLGVGFNYKGDIRYVVSVNGKRGYLTSTYTNATYVPAQNNVSVTFNRNARVYKDAAFSKATGKMLSANTTLDNVNIVSEDGVYGGFTRIVTPSGNYLTANNNYVTVNQNNNDNGDDNTVNDNNANVNANANNGANAGANNGVNFWD